MYLACGLKKGSKCFGILEGLRNLYNYCQDIERTSNAVSRKINYFYFTDDIEGEKLRYGQDEPWKNLKSKHGTTHPSRKNKATHDTIQNDGRAPDTTKQLIKPQKPQPPRSSPPFRYMKKQLHVDGIRLYSDSSFQSYPHNGHASCWVDSTLEAIFWCTLHLGRRFRDACTEYSEKSAHLLHLSQHMSMRLKAYENINTIPELQVEIYKLRTNISEELSLTIEQMNNPLVSAT